MAEGENYSAALDADTAMEFEFEEEQVMRGVNLQYSDKMDEAEEYFEGLKAANARFSLHHAEVAAFKALMSNDLDDITAAITLLSEAEALASQLEHKWRTHSRMKKVNAAMSKLTRKTSALKSWALSKVSMKKVSAEKVATTSAAAEAPEETGPAPGSREEKVLRQRARRVRLRALQIQAECALMTALLQMIAAGESWTNMVKAGYNIKRTWGFFQHCRSKLAQINRDWVALGGSVTNAGPESFAEGYEDDAAGNDDSDHEDEEWRKKMEKIQEENKDDKKTESTQDPRASPAADSPSAVSPVSGDTDDFGDFASATDPKSPSSEDEFGDFKSETTTKEEKAPKRTSSGKVFPEAGEGMSGLKIDDNKLAVLDDASGVKEDAELASLRVGVNFGIGLFNVMMSLIPPQYQKVLEVLGFPADRDEGLKLLDEVSHTRTCRAPLASLMLLQYHMVIMGLLPRSPVHSVAAEKLLGDLPQNWKDSSIFKVLSSRHDRYEGRLTEATEMVKIPPVPAATASSPNSCSARMRSVILNELGWCMLLSGDFTKAADCFGALYKETATFKIHFACLQSACLWEAGPEFHAQAAGILRDMLLLAGAKKAKHGPVELYAIHMATTFTTTQSAPLFPALELAAMYNGIQNMEKAALESHLARVEEALHTRCQRGSYVSDDKSKDVGTELVGSLLSSANDDDESSSPKAESRSPRKATAGGKATYNHEWSEASKMLCRFLLGVIQRSLGMKEKAEDSLRYVVVAGENIPGNASPYSCYELGSMLLGVPETVLDGMKLLEKSITYPPHEFQGRLKFVVTERIRMYRESLPGTSFRSHTLKK